MAGGSPKPPTPVDPVRIINAQEQANRVNRITPFGSQTYGPDGSLTTTIPQGTQNAYNNVSSLAGNQQQLLQRPQGFGNLQNEIMNRVSNRYAQPQGQKANPQQFPQQIGGANVNPVWGQVLGRIYGGPQQ